MGDAPGVWVILGSDAMPLSMIDLPGLENRIQRGTVPTQSPVSHDGGGVSDRAPRPRFEFQEAGGRRQEAGGRRQEAGGRRQELAFKQDLTNMRKPERGTQNAEPRTRNPEPRNPGTRNPEPGTPEPRVRLVATVPVCS
jgi:hypothetical protein